jgi:hypothetical protein
MLPSVPPEAFIMLAQLEQHWHTPSGRKVWRLLDRLNEAARLFGAPKSSEPLNAPAA